MGIIKFNGIKSDDLGLIVQFIPTYKYPEKEYDTLHIPGRNGDLVVNKGSFHNVDRTYSIAKVFKPGENFISNATAIASWLHSADGYARLEDSYEPEYYRMALYKSDGEMSNFLNQVTALDITFECKPQRWLISGEKEINITSGESIKNPTKYDSSPVFSFNIVNNSLSSTIKIGDIELEILPFNTQENIQVFIDCENMECYSPTKLLNSYLKLKSGSFPILKGNDTTNIIYDNITNFKIQPRWWTL